MTAWFGIIRRAHERIACLKRRNLWKALRMTEMTFFSKKKRYKTSLVQFAAKAFTLVCTSQGEIDHFGPSCGENDQFGSIHGENDRFVPNNGESCNQSHGESDQFGPSHGENDHFGSSCGENDHFSSSDGHSNIFAELWIKSR